MSEFVRIPLANGFEASVSADYAKAAGLKPLDAPAIDHRGRPRAASRQDGRPVKPRTTVKKAAAKKASARKAASSTAEASTNSGVAATPEEATA